MPNQNAMRKLLLYSLFLFSCASSLAQTQVVTNNGRTYYVNKDIPGQSEDAQGINFILLHEAYSGALLAEHLVMGKITGRRGEVGSWNRKWTVEVNTSSAYNSNRGSIISYNEEAALVTLTFNGKSYMAVRINNSSSLYNFSFTGYVQAETFQLVTDNQVSNVQLVATETIAIQSPLKIGVSGVGFLQLSPGLTDKSGYVNMYRADGARIGYVGFDNADITYVAEIAGSAHVFNNNGTETMRIQNNGNVLIGKSTQTNATYKLDVNGNLRANKVVVNTTGADFVFDSLYHLASLPEVEQFIQQHHHLPGIAPAAAMQQNGLDMGEHGTNLLQKIEELTLYVIEQNKTINKQNAKLIALEKQLKMVAGKLTRQKPHSRK